MQLNHEELLKELERIQDNIENVSKLKLMGKFTESQAAGEIRVLTYRAGRIALNYYNDLRPQKELTN